MKNLLTKKYKNYKIIKQIKYEDLKNMQYYNKYYQYFLFLDEIHENFLMILKKNLFKDFHQKVNIIFCENLMQLNYLKNFQYKKGFLYLVSLKLMPVKYDFILLLSSFFINILEKYLFGKVTFLSDYKINKNFTTSKLYIMNKLIKIIICSYNSILKNNLYIDKKYFIYRNNIDFNFLYDTNNKFNFNIPFKYMNKFDQSLFMINMPIFLVKYLKNDFNCIVNPQEKKLFSLNKKINLLKNIFNTKINLFAKLKDISISFSECEKLKVGDILKISSPNKVIVYTEDNVMILQGVYKILNNEIVLHIKKNFFHTMLLKK